MSDLTYDPQPGYVLCRALKAEDVMASGLKLPEALTKKNANVAEVLRCGTDLIRDEVIRVKAPELDDGDIIAYRPFTDVEVEEGYNSVVFVPFEDIVAIKRSIKHADQS